MFYAVGRGVIVVVVTVAVAVVAVVAFVVAAFVVAAFVVVFVGGSSAVGSDGAAAFMRF